MNPAAKTRLHGKPRGAHVAYLSLGANLGDRLGSICQALARLELKGVKIRRTSSLYETEPVDHQAQPWFLNCVAEVETPLSPRQLLRACKGIERALGRRPGIPKGPREIDIDILFYENVVVQSAALTIPHAQVSARRFVLVPLRELAADLRHPVTQRTVREMLRDTTDSSKVIRLKPKR